MKLILIGHRGVGKTALVQRLQIYQNMRGSPIPAFDLDREIEKATQAKIADIFELVGEKAFRQIEIKTFELLTKRTEYIVSLGAGFELDKLPKDPDVEIVWVTRKTDSIGRIFLDRPRLNKTLSPLAEYQERYQKREDQYSVCADWVYEMPEGLTSPNDIEKSIFFHQVEDIGGIFTLHPHHLQSQKNFGKYVLNRGHDKIELRDDLISAQEIEKIITLLPKDHILVSCRIEKTPDIVLKTIREGYEFDWAKELTTSPPQAPTIYSIHERSNNSIQDILSRFEAYPKSHHKLAIEVHDYGELQQCLEWQQQSPQTRSFLPRSKTGRWSWVRLWLKHQQKLNFISGHINTLLDQPTLSEWLTISSCHQEFAAVLGHPVIHSYSPAEHQPYFKSRGLPFFAVDVSEHEWDTALPLLIKMGLRYAAVTSPHKKRAFQFANQHTEVAHRLKSANTLVLESSNTWWAHNTDLEGLESLLETESDLGETIIWGGGGTLPVIHALRPNAEPYSARTGKHRDLDRDSTMIPNPNTIIWAAAPDANLPPSEWSPNRIIDLNYRDDSRAKEYAQSVGAKYISGLLMFKSQAQAQRQFWERF